MNASRLLPFLLTGLLFPGLPALRAAEQLQLTPRLFVFKNADFRTVETVPAPAAEGHLNATVVQSPATLRFDDTVLSLQGGEYRWNSGEAAPASIASVPVQPLRIQFNQPATIRCTAPTQYLEKQADGTFRIREIAADSPDVPRYLLTFVAEPADNAALNLLVTCRSEIATVLSREPIPGVDLDVGRPRLSVRQDEIKLAMRVGEWAALLLRAPKENDYSILALFKIAAVGAAPQALATGSSPPTPQALPPAAPSSTLTVLVAGSGALTDTGAAAPKPTPRDPVRYLAYDGGFFERSPRAADEERSVPSTTQMSTALHAAMESQGFATAATGKPPAIVLVYHWGSIKLDDRLKGGFPMAPSTKSLAFVIISAYDYADLTRHEKTLLWRAGLHSLDRPNNTPLDTTLIALMRSIGPLLGRNLATQRGSSVILPAPGDDTADAASAPAALAGDTFGALNGEVVRALIAQERERLESKFDLPMKHDMEPHQPIPPLHR
jgi:hypothetical protein